MSGCARCSVSLPDDTSRLCAACLLALAAESSGTDSPTMTAFGSGSTSSAPGAPQLEAGQIFGAYRIERLLGKGGMGEVYQAEQLEHGRRVALKVLNQWMADPEDRARFLREGQLAASVNHPNSVYIFGSEEIAGAPVITMELLAGGTLKDVVERDGPMEPAAAVEAIRQVAAGLDAAYQGGILHRDVKPSNCFVDLDGTVKIGDFGLSISTLARHGDALRAAGSIQGTPQFAAPEQLKGEPLDVRADIYAVGATLYYLLTGRPPFDDSNLASLLSRVAAEPARSPRALRRAIPTGLADLTLRCLSKSRAERPASYAALVEALEPFEPAAAVPAPPVRRFVAGVLDFHVVILSLVPLRLLIESVVPDVPSNAVWWKAVMGCLYVAAAAAYYGLLEGRWGVTAGKAACGLRLAGTGGGPPGILPAAARALLFAGGAALLRVLLPVALPIASGVKSSRGLVLISIGCHLVFFATARRTNGWRGVHDLAAGTRVVLRRTREVAAAAPAIREPMAAGGALVGPFRLSAPGRPPQGVLVRAVDERLGRAVWVCLASPDSPPTPEWRRNLRRPGRIRWLAGRRLPGDAWDAFEAPDGQPLLALTGERHSWAAVRRWLRDLVDELQIADGDGSTPSLELDRVWIDGHGRARLLDWPAPHSADGRAPHAPDTSAAALICRVAVTALEGRTPDAGRGVRVPEVPLPLSAREALLKLCTGGAPASDAGLFEGPAAVGRATRARHLGVVGGSLLVFGLSGLLSGMLLAQEGTPVVRALVWGFAGSVVFSAHLLCIVSLTAAATSASAGPVLSMLRLAAVDPAGAPVRRGRALLRTLAAWSPMLALDAFWLLSKLIPSLKPWNLGMQLVCIAALAVGAMVALRDPQRGLQDRVAGTWLVPR